MCHARFNTESMRFAHIMFNVLHMILTRNTYYLLSSFDRLRFLMEPQYGVCDECIECENKVCCICKF